jgi:RimJ/RimL family protein N-acetyltransferase
MAPFAAILPLKIAGESLLFRPVRLGDEAELLAFFRDRLSERSQYFFCCHDPSQPEECLAEFGERIRRHGERRDLTLVVEQEGAIVGYFFLWGLDRTDGRPPTLGIGLADRLHGSGVGPAMLDHLIERGRALGLTAIELTHESTNTRAARLYLSRGFTYTGRDHQWDPESPRIEREMRLSLLSQAPQKL